MAFDKTFVFGAATAAYQIEGAHDIDRSPSIWDMFSHSPGRTKNGETGDVACDHYHRYREDIALMKELGLDAYRLSISWPRIFTAQGEYNPKGMAFYKEVLQELQRQGIKAAVTLYHWDLPMWAHEQGGWLNRAVCDWFEEFAATCFRELDAYVFQWITHNEPWCQSFLSYYQDCHAPGGTDARDGMVSAHHILLSHGRAVQAYRRMGGTKPIGITLNVYPAYPASDNFGDRVAADLVDAYQNRWFLNPLFKGTYSTALAAAFGGRIADYNFIQEGDMAVIAAPCDFLGINYYSHNKVRYNPEKPLLFENVNTGLKQTSMGWDVIAPGLYDILTYLRRYTALPLYITENGSAWPDTVDKDGKVHDKERVDYLIAHLKEIERANEMGLNVKGYYAWSLLDNFEWTHGYSQRFGIIYTDYKTLKRIPKDSYYAYQKVIRNRTT